MIIDYKKNFVFIHTYRTGGSSIEHAFGGANPHYDIHTRLEDVPNWKDYFSFGFVRNPWDRLVSSYMYLIARKKFKGSFDEYVKEFAVSPKNTTKKYAQYNMLRDCNYVGRFEYLQKDFNDICKIIGVQQKKLPHIWKTDHKRYTQMFTPEQKDIVLTASSGDVEYYGFDFKSSATKNIGRIR